jgi:hypothetical protein
VVDWREPVLSPQDGRRSPALPVLAEPRELEEAAARFLLQRCDSQVSPADEPWREQRRQQSCAVAELPRSWETLEQRRFGARPRAPDCAPRAERR